MNHHKPYINHVLTRLTIVVMVFLWFSYVISNPWPCHPSDGLPEARQLHGGQRAARRVPQQQRQGIWRLAEQGSDLQGRNGIMRGHDGYTMATYICIYIYICMHACTHECIHTYSVCMYMYVLFVYVCMYIEDVIVIDEKQRLLNE